MGATPLYLAIILARANTYSRASVTWRVSSTVGRANPCSAIGRKLVVNVETSVHKASLPEKINYCAERLSAHAYTGKRKNEWREQ